MGKNVFEWNGSKVTVRAVVLARRLWLAASIDVYLDGKPILRTNGRFFAVGAVTTNFAHRGEWHRATVSWGAYAVGGFPYTLTIDGERVAESQVPIENPGGMWACGVFAVLFLLAAAVILGSVTRGRW